MPGVDDLPRIQLTGSELDLENLAALLDGSKYRVTKEAQLWWLRCDEWAELVSDPEALRARAIELLPLVNGAARAVFPTFGKVELGQCVDYVRSDGLPKRRLTDCITINVVSAARVGADQKGLAAVEVDRARHHDAVADVLRLWGSTVRHDWSMLYKLKEKINAAAGGSRIVDRGWATRAELRRFDHTANSHGAIGDDARHGVPLGAPPRQPMSLSDAQDLVGRLIRRWLDDLHTLR